MTDPEHMGIDSHGSPAEGYGLYHVGCLAAYARQCQQCVEILRNVAPMLSDEGLRHGDEMAGLAVGIGY